jgi:hypothetical protein
MRADQSFFLALGAANRVVETLAEELATTSGITVEANRRILDAPKNY